MSAPFRPGEVVDITIKGARVLTFDDHGVLVFRYANDDDEASGRVVYLGAEGVTAERVAPAEWPPLLGDVWRDRFGDLWFGIERTVDGETNVDLTCAIDKAWPYDHDIVREYGPLTLVHREPEQDGAES